MVCRGSVSYWKFEKTMALFKDSLLVWLLMSICFSKCVFQAQPLPAIRETIINPSDLPGSPISIVCQATRYPELCESSMSTDSRSEAANSTELVRIAIDLASIEARGSYALIQAFVNSSTATFMDINTTSAAVVCEETLGYGISALTASRDFLLVRNPVEDIQAWLSSVLQFQYDCLSALVNLDNPPAMVVSMLPQVNSTMQLISNALCMTDALATYGSVASGWQPPAEIRPANLTSAFFTDINPEWIGQNDSCLLQPPLSYQTPNVTVSLDGFSNYTSVQQAIDNAPTYGNGRYIIYIKEGVYNESIRVHQNKTQLAFVGDGASKTILTGSKSASPGMTTFQTATVVVAGKGFICSGITFQNTAGPNVSQAVAVRVDSDMSVFQDCVFDGYQDTLYAHTGRHLYTNCSVLGTVDYIFGNAAALFQNCQLVVRLGRPGATTSVVTAQGRTDPGQTTGLVFQNCTVTGTPEYMQSFVSDPDRSLQAFLGRPWKLFSRTVFLNTYIESLIDPAGWFPWMGDFALDTLLYGEFASSGPGAAANVSSRVPWSNQLTQEEAQFFSVDKFIQGSSWLPCTGVPYVSA